jgi:hypothetical protein
MKNSENSADDIIAMSSDLPGWAAPSTEEIGI